MLREFGVFPSGKPTTVGGARSRLRLHFILWYYFVLLFFGLFGLAGLDRMAFAFSEGTVTRAVGSLLGGFLLLCIAAFMTWHLCRTCPSLSVAIHGDIIRRRHLVTLRSTEHHIQDLCSIRTLLHDRVLCAGRPRRTLYELLLGKVRGFQLLFSDGAEYVYRPEMTNIRQLIEAIIGKMSERGEVVPVITKDGDGKDYILEVRWKEQLAGG